MKAFKFSFDKHIGSEILGLQHNNAYVPNINFQILRTYKCQMQQL